MDDLSSGKYNKYAPYVVYSIVIILLIVCFYLVSKSDYKASFWIGFSATILGLGTYFLGRTASTFRSS